MKTHISKTTLVIFTLIISSVSYAALMDKKTFLETISDSLSDTLCVDDYNICFGVTEKDCLKEVSELFNSQCTSDVPDEIEDMDEIRSYATSVSTCVTTKYLAEHKESLKANAASKECISLK